MRAGPCAKHSVDKNMHDTTPVPWNELSDSARTTVVWWIRKLAGDTNDRVCFECHQGGIRSVTVETVVERNDDGSRQIRVRSYEPGELD